MMYAVYYCTWLINSRCLVARIPSAIHHACVLRQSAPLRRHLDRFIRFCRTRPTHTRHTHTHTETDRGACAVCTSKRQRACDAWMRAFRSDISWCHCTVSGCCWCGSIAPVHGHRRENEKSLLYFGCDFSGWYNFGKIVKRLKR